MANPVLWFDVMGKNGKSLGSFYSKLFGWEFKQKDTERIAYGVLSLGEDGGVGGVVTTSPDDGNCFATFSVEVNDISTTLAQVEELGGKTKMLAYELFDDAFQEELATLYAPSLRGQPPIPPAQLALATIVQAYTGASDDEVIEATLMDRHCSWCWIVWTRSRRRSVKGHW